MPAAIILAAGDSARMGKPKALLADPVGRPFIARLVRSFMAAGIAEIVVVTGPSHDDVERALADDRLEATRLVRNPDPSRGPLSSLWAGLDAVMRPELDAVLMTPVDVPMVRAETIAAVVEAWKRTGAPVVRPAVRTRHGHPVLFDRAVFAELRRAPLDRGAKAVVRAHGDRIVNVEVDDEGCVVDIDTPADYAAMLDAARFEKSRP